MFRVSGPDLVIAACRAGVVCAFPTANCRSVEQLDGWLSTIAAALEPDDAPFCANLIMRRETLQAELECLVRHRVRLVITSVGSPAAAIRPLHDIGCTVLADVATLAHAEKALAAGADGLVLLSSGAGGQTGWLNGLAFARAVRARFDGPLVLAGGVSDGAALLAAQAVGCTLAYMGTRFIATRESMAEDGWKEMVVAAEIDDILQSSAFTGLPTNMLVPSIRAAGLDPAALPDTLAKDRADALYGAGGGSIQRWRDIWSAGHSVSGVAAIMPAADLISTIATEYTAARAALASSAAVAFAPKKGK